MTSMPSIAVSGATGFLGRAMASTLHKKNYVVFGLTRGVADQTPVAGTTYRVVDYASSESLSAGLRGCSGVVHLAGIAHAHASAAQGEMLAEYRSAIVESTLRLWDAAASAGCQTFVYASSVKVYGESSGGAVIDEDSKCEPVSVYGRCKLEAEGLLRERAKRSNMRLCILRFPPMYGPNMKGAVRHLFRTAKWHIPLPVYGLTNQRSFLFVGNAALIVEAVLRGDLAEPLYVLGEPPAWTIGEFYSAIHRAVHGSDLPRLLRWSMPDLLAKKMQASTAPWQALLVPFAVRSKYTESLEKLGLFDSSSALAITAKAKDHGQQ